MKVKRIFLILMIFLIIFATLSVSSAGWFDFLGGDDNDEPDLGFIYVHCIPDYVPDNYRIIVDSAELKSTNPNMTDAWVKNKYIEINLTDENGETIDSRSIEFPQFFSSSVDIVHYSNGYYAFSSRAPSVVDFNDLEPGTYVISFYYQGDKNVTEYKYNETIVINESLKDTYHEPDPSTVVANHYDERMDDGGLKSVTSYKDGHTQTIYHYRNGTLVTEETF